MTTDNSRTLAATSAALARLDRISRWTSAIQFGAVAIGVFAVVALLDIHAYGAAGIVALLTPLVWLVGYVVELQVTAIVWRSPDLH